MSRYFFDLRDGDEIAVDEEGVELPNLARAQEEAVCSLAELARERVLESFDDWLDMAVNVRDEHGLFMTVGFSFAPDRVRH